VSPDSTLAQSVNVWKYVATVECFKTNATMETRTVETDVLPLAKMSPNSYVSTAHGHINPNVSMWVVASNSL
jgi:hypothetical protein